jgi:hypothetical protein
VLLREGGGRSVRIGAVLLRGGGYAFMGAVRAEVGPLREGTRVFIWGRVADVVGLETSGTEKSPARWGRVGCLGVPKVFRFGSVGCLVGAANESLLRFGRVGCRVGVDRLGRVGCLVGVAKESFRPSVWDEMFVSVLARLRALDIFVSVRERLESIDIPVLVRGRYRVATVDEVSVRNNNPRRDSLESARDKGYNGIEMTLPPSPSSSTFGNVGRVPTSKFPTSSSFFFSGFGSYLFLRRSASICEIRLSTL